MKKRKSLSKKIRFEVFKRDRFTCHYCGRKAPEVILQCDHIKPVSKGGTNDLLNLLTSCEDCNSGKSNIELDDNTVLSKQHYQLELLQERREQIELLLQWKASLENFEEEKVKILIHYIEQRIKPYTLVNNSHKFIASLLRKFTIEELMNGIDIGTQKYLRYDTQGQVIHNSVERFISKIGGITATQRMSPIQQAIVKIKAIGKAHLVFYREYKMKQLLNDYVQKMDERGWTEEEILAELNGPVVKMTTQIKGWGKWIEKIENWTNSLTSWERSDSLPNTIATSSPIPFDALRRAADSYRIEILGRIHLILHLGKCFEEFDKKAFLTKLEDTIQSFLKNQDLNGNFKELTFFAQFIAEKRFYLFFLDSEKDELKGMVLEIAKRQISVLLADLFESLHIPTLGYEGIDAEQMLSFYRDIFKEGEILLAMNLLG